MRSKYFIPLVIVLSCLLVVPVFGQTEDEIVAKFMKKAEKMRVKKIGFAVIHGSYGRLDNNNTYNQFANQISPQIAGIQGLGAGLPGIYRSKEFFAGFGIMATPQASVTFGFNYWLKLGSDQKGDFNLVLLNAADSVDHLGFDLTSEIQIFGFSSSVDYYLLNPPTKDGILPGFSLKAVLGGGYYFAKWQLWDSFAGNNLDAAVGDDPITVVESKLSGSAPGFTIGMAAEYPLGIAGLVVEGSAIYRYLNFSSMKWYNESDEEIVATYQNDGERVELDFSGPRARLGFKRYFSW